MNSVCRYGLVRQTLVRSDTQHGREPAVHWAPGNSPYLSSGQDDPNSYPYLPTVLEEPSSSFSEAADDDPLPAIDALRISGEAFPGRELQASGYSINGTTSCNFGVLFLTPVPLFQPRFAISICTA
ncbi:hypothetical protein B296_00038368 [Ensete ventricosum]|uniref:Uncharacterized protein n=1 Tax=Ensete ventricosum TaxID=4639 RepID=A0A426Y2X4_ENSVE|nr:hypothetical protein B296_00038368 [Ensete ventricosum]